MKNKITKKLLVRYLILIITLFVSSLVFNIILLPSKIVAGGSNGIAIIINYFFEIKPSITILIISVSLLVASLFLLGIKKTSATLVATFIYPLFIQMTAPLAYLLDFQNNDILLFVIVGGILSGLTTGICFKIGFTTGGISTIYQILYKYFKISISTSNLVINTLIVIVSGFYFGWTNVMYAILLLYINHIVIDMVLLGISKNKAVYIITDKTKEAKEFIMNELNCGVTVFKVKGSTNNQHQVIMAVVQTRSYYRLTDGIKKIDPYSFYTVMDAYQVEGAYKKNKFTVLD